MILILDGPDGSGKTTLANRLSQQTGYPVVHFSNPKTEEEKVKMFNMYLQELNANRNVILDRSWYSEMVYGPILRGASAISYPQMYKLEERIAKVGGMFIHCTGNIGQMWKQCQERGEFFITDFKIYTEICRGFIDLVQAVPHKIPVVEYVIGNV